MWLRTSCLLEFDIPEPTPFLLMLRPRSGWQQWVSREEYVFTPSVPAVEFTDSFGNLCQRLVAPSGNFSIRTSSDIMTSDSSDTGFGAPFIEVQHLPAELLPYLYPSRYCDSDLFTDMAASLTSHVAPGYDQVHAIVDYIRNNLRFTPFEGESNLSASQVNQAGSGVCRDLAHLAIALCRAISIPSRLVVGYFETLEPMDLHAWMEVYVGHRWYALDPTQPDMKGGRVAIGYGRDAADVAIYTQFGELVEPVTMQIDVQRIADLNGGPVGG